MKPPDVALRELVLQWLDKAAADLDVAEELCTQGDRFREIIAFHCQQAAEKYLKAFLVRHQIEFPKTHDIAKLLDRVATVHANMAESLRDADALRVTPATEAGITDRVWELAELLARASAVTRRSKFHSLKKLSLYFQWFHGLARQAFNVALY
jgi:HEPN domain-containing protein